MYRHYYSYKLVDDFLPLCDIGYFNSKKSRWHSALPTNICSILSLELLLSGISKCVALSVCIAMLVRQIVTKFHSCFPCHSISLNVIMHPAPQVSNSVSAPLFKVSILLSQPRTVGSLLFLSLNSSPLSSPGIPWRSSSTKQKCHRSCEDWIRLDSTDRAKANRRSYRFLPFSIQYHICNVPQKR